MAFIVLFPKLSYSMCIGEQPQLLAPTLRASDPMALHTHGGFVRGATIITVRLSDSVQLTPAIEENGSGYLFGQ